MLAEAREGLDGGGTRPLRWEVLDGGGTRPLPWGGQGERRTGGDARGPGMGVLAEAREGLDGGGTRPLRWEVWTGAGCGRSAMWDSLVLCGIVWVCSFHPPSQGLKHTN